jgi:hypothetical protein
MPNLQHFKSRRKEFLSAIDTPVLLMAGGWISRNYPANWSPFRADSTFLFFFPDPEPNAAALFDPKDGSVTLFLDERTPEDALWHGPVPSFADMKKAHGVTAVEKRASSPRKWRRSSASASCARSRSPILAPRPKLPRSPASRSTSTSRQMSATATCCSPSPNCATIKRARRSPRCASRPR